MQWKGVDYLENNFQLDNALVNLKELGYVLVEYNESKEHLQEVTSLRNSEMAKYFEKNPQFIYIVEDIEKEGIFEKYLNGVDITLGDVQKLFYMFKMLNNKGSAVFQEEKFEGEIRSSRFFESRGHNLLSDYHKTFYVKKGDLLEVVPSHYYPPFEYGTILEYVDSMNGDNGKPCKYLQDCYVKAKDGKVVSICFEDVRPLDIGRFPQEL